MFDLKGRKELLELLLNMSHVKVMHGLAYCSKGTVGHQVRDLCLGKDMKMSWILVIPGLCEPWFPVPAQGGTVVQGKVHMCSAWSLSSLPQIVLKYIYIYICVCLCMLICVDMYMCMNMIVLCMSMCAYTAFVYMYFMTLYSTVRILLLSNCAI